MASLTGQLVAETYKALLKLIDNDILTASEKQITDGFGGGSNVFIDSQGFLRANKYKVTNGLATQFLKADGSLDSNAYLTSITGAQVITALGYTPVPTTRTITINGETHNLAADNSWTVGGTAAIWGNITGTLSNQTDLQNALNSKYNNPTGTISQYIRGDGTLATFPTMPGGLPTGGSAGQILSKIDATDYNAQWIDNYATQTKNEVKLGQTLTKGTPVYVSSANGTNMIVSAASNTSEALSSKTFGLLESGGATNDIVKCVTFGLLAGLDTSAASAGDPVWLGPNGTLIYGLINKPYAPAHLVYIGVVTRVQSNNGEIFVNVQNGFELKEIHDVYIADPANNHGLFYDIADGLWKNKSIAGALGYTPQAQLSGTGFVKASGTTITYDNSTYLTTTDAASTYQRLDKMVSNLLPSATEYPNSNAVIAALALKADAANPVFTGNMTISGAEPKLYFTDTDQNPDYFIGADAGFFRVYDQTAGATRFVINSDGNISTGVGKSITAGSFIKESGTASQFLKADGSIDSNSYALSSALGNYLPLAGGTMTNTNLVTNLNADLLDGYHHTRFAVGQANNIDSNAELDDFSRLNGMYRVNPTATTSAPYSSYWSMIEYGNVSNVVGQLVSHFVDGETYVRAYNTSWSAWRKLWDNVNLANPIAGTGTTNYIPKWTSTSGLGNSLIYDNGTKVFIGTTNTNSISTGGLTLSNATSSSLVLYNGAVIGFIYGSSVAAGMAISSDKDMRFETGDGSGSNWPERMRLFQLTGNLRLGYGNSPADTGYKFDVNGTGRFQGSATINGSSSCLLVTDGTNNSFIGLASVGGAYGNGTIAGDIVVRGTNGISLTPGSGSLTALRIASNGDSIFSNIVDAGTFAGNPLNYIDGTNISANTRKYRAIHSRTNNDYATVGLDLSNTQPTNNIYSPIISFSSITSGNVYNCTYAAIWGQKTADEGSWAAGDLIFGTANPYGVTQRMRLLANGNFGVGTASPVKKLDIVATGEQLRIAYDTSGSVYTDFRNDSAGGLLVNTSSGYIIHYITGSPIMRMNANGNVLIGTSTDNGARLRVVGGTIDFAGDTRYGVARIYNASVGDMFGMEQVGSTQTGGGAATRIFTANSSGNFLSLGWYTNATSFNDALRISCTSGLATFNSIDTSGNRTSPFTAMIISSDNNSNPYNGSGTALLFRNRIYAGGPSPGGMQDGARIRSWINTNSSENLGTDLVFDVTTTGNGSLTQILRLSYNGGASFSANVTATAFFESSDIRLKTLIESNPIIDGIEKLEAKLYEKDGKIELGYFAQDAELIMQYAVTKNADGFLNLSYREVHTAKIARLEKEVAELKAQLNLN